MEFSYAYRGSSSVQGGADRTDMSFAPDTKREPTFFRGELAKSLPFREAISALHDVVVSDLRFQPKDRTAYMEWLATQDELDWAHVLQQRGTLGQQIETLRHELDGLRRTSSERMAPFYRARKRYFDYLYRTDMDYWYVLDPVITVHPDELFFECFSQDESTYGKLGASYEVFTSLGERACGTTNVDYSQALYDEFQKIRSYKTTWLEVDPSGFEVETTDEDSYKEVKIDLPDSWVRGFLQVSSAMSLPAITFELHPMDIHNFCFVLRRHKELHGPRSMRYVLTPGQPVKVIFEPWNIEVICARSIYQGDTAEEVRVWGRRRIHILERLVPVAKRFVVHLLGSGLPAFYVADLGDMSFTLGLSGWTANDWSSAGNFDLMAPRTDVDDLTKRRVFDALKENWYEAPESLARRLQLDRSIVLGALSAYTQAGRAIFDIDKGVYRVRELSREPLPMDRLRFVSPREEAATRLVEAHRVSVRRNAAPDQCLELTGTVKDGSHVHQAMLLLDADRRMIQARCSCNFYQQNKLFQGPCEHILALRMAKSEKRSFWNRFR
ncbi:SWIM zinc finger family protein [Thiorhodococcus fuscus]|uniref:SWIM zinc finger family protein n=1 Tax=Thiorhodococcus fuscus TaxID=527200 RepID=A0ABW4Y5G8_9GAMM